MFAFAPWPVLAAAASLALLAVVLLEERRLSSRIAEIEARDHRITKVETSVNLLESRATSLRQEITTLEEERQALLVIIPESGLNERLRTALAGRTAHASTASAKVAAR